MKSVGLVLSGGGARCAAHLGLLKALDELDIKVCALSGVSGGAIAGALYAAGNSPDVILAVLKNIAYFSITEFAWFKNGLFTMNALRNTLSDMIGQDNFEDLKIPFYVTATDITRGKSLVFSRGELFSMIVASASIPVIFEPVLYDDSQLVDGGILNNLPVEPLSGKCDVIIGSHVNKLYDGERVVGLSNISMIEHCFHMAIGNTVMRNSKLCDVFIEPLLAGYRMFDMNHADDIFKIGYHAAMDQKETLLRITGLK